MKKTKPKAKAKAAPKSNKRAKGFDRVAYQREYMRKRREAARKAKKK